eukprot:COSAG06_NODE_29188_length_561_cov_0.668831_1_plen_104_part_00
MGGDHETVKRAGDAAQRELNDQIEMAEAEMAESDDDVVWEHIEHIKTMPYALIPPFDNTDGTQWPFGITADGDFDEEAATMATYAVRGVFYDRNDTTLMHGDT